MNNCRVCGNTHDNKVHIFRERYLGLGDPFEYIECGACKSLSIVDVPEDLWRYYPETYYSYTGRPYSRFLGLVKGLRDRHYLGKRSNPGKLTSSLLPAPKYIEWLVNLDLPLGSSILDVGCGAGTLVVNLKDAGYQSSGIDPYISKPIRYANGAEILKQSLEETTGSYDCIMLHHSLEHMASPHEVFVHINRLLKPNGRLLIRLPITGTYAWKTYGENWFQLDAPRHFVLFTESALCTLAGKYKFPIRKIVYDSIASQFWGSEQYARGIAHISRTSYAIRPDNSIFSPQELQAFTELTNELNLNNNGDQASFYFTKATDDD